MPLAVPVRCVALALPTRLITSLQALRWVASMGDRRKTRAPRAGKDQTPTWGAPVPSRPVCQR